MRKLIALIGILTLLSSCDSAQWSFDHNVSSLEEFATENVPPVDSNGESLKSEYDKADIYFIMQHISIDEDNQQYVLNLDRSEALEYGLTENLYDEVCQCIEDGNTMIKKAISEGEIMTLCLPCLSLDETAQQDIQPMPYPSYGTLVTGGKEEAMDGFRYQEGLTRVYFVCKNNVATVASHICSVYLFGEKRSITLIGSYAYEVNGGIPIVINASEYTAMVSYKTTDQYGGYCSWSTR